jgi:hypothetical protein
MQNTIKQSGTSLNDKYWAMSTLHDAIRAAAYDPLIDSGMTSSPNDEQVDLELVSELDNVPHRMAGKDMRMKLDLGFSRHFTGTLKDFVEAPRRGPRLFSNFFDVFRHVIDFFHRNHV